jgi:hypothetical protein
MSIYNKGHSHTYGIDLNINLLLSAAQTKDARICVNRITSCFNEATMSDEQIEVGTRWQCLVDSITRPGPIGLLAYLFCALIALLLLVPSGWVTDPIAKILSSLVWPGLILAGCLLFRHQANLLLINISERIQGGDAFIIPHLLQVDARSVAEKAARIPEPPEGHVVTIANMALLHTSFLPKKKPDFHDGLTYLQIEIIIIAPMSVMSRIESVTYRFEDSYPMDRREQIRTNRTERFKIKELANGTSIVRAEIKFNDGERSTHLNRFIDLRPDGPRI